MLELLLLKSALLSIGSGFSLVRLLLNYLVGELLRSTVASLVPERTILFVGNLLGTISLDEV